MSVDLLHNEKLETKSARLLPFHQISHTAAGPVVTSVDKSRLQTLALQCRRVLMDQPRHRLPTAEFRRRIDQHYMSACDTRELQRDLSDVVKVMIDGRPDESSAQPPCSLSFRFQL